MNITYKESKSDEELLEVETLAREIWEDHFTPIIGERQVEYMLEKFNSVKGLRHHIIEMGYHVQRVFLNKQLIGYLAFAFQENKLFLSKFYLHRSVRGQGIGRKCFEHLITLARSSSCMAIQLTVNKYNADTIAAYHKMGFTTVDEIVTDIGDGFVMDDFVMEYTI